MRLVILLLPLALIGCSKQDLEIQYSHVDINGFSINQLPHLDDGYEYDPMFGEEADVFVVIRNQEGLIYEVTNTQYDVGLQDMPIEYWWTSLSPSPNYRDELVFEVYDDDGDEHELIGRLSLHPFEVNIEHGSGTFDITEGEISIHGTMQFYE